MTKRVVMYSGGLGSWSAAMQVVKAYPNDPLTLLFADTLMEDEDLYRFLDEGAEAVGVPVTRIAEGRDPWQVFFDRRYLGNTRIDPCSLVLKRQFLRRYIESNFSPSDTVIYLGIDWTEIHRFERAKPYWHPWTIEAPLCEPPLLSKEDILSQLASYGIEPPRLYAMGFPHNNCGGFCIKAGQAHFRLLLEKMPERYAYHEQKEQDIRTYLNKDVAILRDRREGKVKPLTLAVLRKRIEQGKETEDEWGGCGCFSPTEVSDD
jgi:hypothetical protein